MENIQIILEQLTKMQWSDYLDIIAVACLIYWLIPLFRTTGTGRIARVVVAVLVIAWLTDLLHMHTLSFILNQFLAVGLIAIVVLFQPELRRVIDHLSNVKLKKLLTSQEGDQQMVPVIQQTVRACEEMSKERIGALIVFARDSHIEEYSKTGTIIDAQPSEHLIRNIFFPKAALHDGAMIIRDGRVLAAGCVLPLSESDRLNADLGTRHRAAVGMSEATDAVVVVVSEETGVVSVAVGGMLKRHLAPQTLERLLRTELCHEEQEDQKKVKLLQKFKKKDKGGITQ
ncbi:MAG: diadenylate cyclase CdaA [Oscillospiraceae bacterium]|nr:diadenylate cyclase CdaA [Oscillospiraceae bacterium]